MSKKTKLELTWIGKEHRPQVEPRILLEEAGKSYHAAHRVTDRGDGIFDIIGDHADERETSLLLHLTPELVLPKEDWGDGSDNPWTLPAMREKWAWAQRAWTQATNDTGCGDPQHATAEKGARYFEVLSRKIGGFFTDLAAADVGKMYRRPDAPSDEG